MFVTIVTDSEEAPVELVYFLLGAGHDSDLQKSQAVTQQKMSVAGDYVVADVAAKGAGSLEWLSGLPTNRTSVLLRSANPSLRKQLLAQKFDQVLQFPAQIRELGEALRAAALLFGKEQASLMRSRFRLGNAELDMASRRLVSPRHSILLTGSEARALGCLAKTPGVPVTRRQLEISCGSGFAGQASRKIDVLMSAIRQKLEHVEAEIEIMGIRGVGYQLTGKIEPS